MLSKENRNINWWVENEKPGAEATGFSFITYTLQIVADCCIYVAKSKNIRTTIKKSLVIFSDSYRLPSNGGFDDIYDRLLEKL
ncbi:MAG: hypothetical protein H8E17_16490 [Deltaproteobacteria bacterium]|nr:hypothetical protein [Deltaproteobacteria bacterium]